jgi:hypothetical protein
VEILGDDEDDRTVADGPPVDPRATAWAPGSSVFSSRAPDDGSATSHDSQDGRRDGAQRLRPVTGAAAPALDLGEQARDPAWEQVWNTGPIPLSTVRVDADEAPAPAAQPAAGDAPAAAAAVPTAAPAAPPAGPRALLVGTVASSESLGVAGVFVALATALSSFPSMFAFMSNTGGSPSEQFDAFAMSFALGGVLAAALGVGACLRLGPGSHPLVRGLAGGAVILGVLLVVLAAFTAIQVGDVQTFEGTDSG